MEEKIKWLYCPVCRNKTRLKIREDTELKKLPPLLSEMQTGNVDKSKKVSDCSYKNKS